MYVISLIIPEYMDRGVVLFGLERFNTSHLLSKQMWNSDRSDSIRGNADTTNKRVKLTVRKIMESFIWHTATSYKID